jgi:hypothetical protein
MILFVMAGPDPAIQPANKTKRLLLWMAGSSPAMTLAERRACR